MKLKVLNKIKVALISLLVILLAGAVTFGIFGLNETADHKDGFELSVKVDANIANASDVIKTSTDAYLESKGLSYNEFSLEKLDEGGELIIKFTKDVKDVINCDELAEHVETALQEYEILKGLDVSANYYAKNSFVDNGIGYILIGAGIALVVAFIYALFMQKASGAFTVLGISLGSALVFLALLAITRIPARPFLFATITSSAVLGAVFATGIIDRCKETAKLYEKKSYIEVADVNTSESILRIGFVSGAVILLALAFLAIGPSYLRFLGLQLILTAVSASFVSLFFTGYLWAVLKSFGKKKRPEEKAKEVA